MRIRTILSEIFASLKYPNYRIWFYGQLFSLVGTWMQSTAQGYLVYELTQSAAYLGYVSFFNGAPSWLFTLYAGVIADRIPRRTLILINQAIMMMLAFILAALTFSGLVQPWHILVLAFILGISNSFDAPARQSFIAELVDRNDLTNAISLNAAMFTGASVVGPAVGGLIYAWVGPGWCFLFNGLSFVAVIAALLLLRMPRFVPPPRGNVIQGIREGLAFVFRTPMVRLLIMTVGMTSMFAFSLLTLIPAWATLVLGGDVRTNGVLLAARGVGALSGALMLAALASRNLRGRIWLMASFMVPLGMLAFSLNRSVLASMVLLAFIGWSMVSLINNSNSLIQSRVPDILRGRVMGIYVLIFIGAGPIGSLFIAWAAELLGAPAAVQICAVTMLVFSLWMFIRHPEIRSLG
jgi:predicted MFS family arabinose efflux permease